MKAREDHRALIEALGSQTLRRRFRISSARIHNWRLRGIPIAFRPGVAELSRIWGVELPSGFLDPLPGCAPENHAQSPPGGP